MVLSDISMVDLIVGITYSIEILIFIIIGMKIISKYIEHKRIELISVGMAWILISSTSWDNMYYFIYVLLFGEPSELMFAFFIHTFRLGAPLALLLWMYSFTKLVPRSKKNQMIIVSIYIAIQILAVIMYILALITEFSDIFGAANEELFIVIYYQYLTIFLMVLMISILTTGILMAKSASKSGDPRAKLKSKFLLIAFIIVTIGAIISQIALAASGQEGVYDQYHIAPSIALIFVISHVFITLSGFLFYFGFFMPERIYNLLKKSN